MKVLHKYHSALDITQPVPGATNFDFTPVPVVGANQGWIRLIPNLYVSETYFDLKGLAIDDKTIFPSGITCQRGNVPIIGAGAAGDNYQVLDVLTSIPVDITDIQLILNWFNVGAGFPGSTLNFEHVLYMRGQRWTVDVDTNAQFPLKADEWQSGSMMPTASDRVYSYRIVTIRTNVDALQIITDTARHVMQVDVSQEPTYEYMMRLKRSYDLQQSPDVD